MRPPKVYSIDEHLIPHFKIDKQAYYVIEKLRTNGFLSFLVGGSVRDLLLNAKPKDFDIVTIAKPEEIKKLFRRNCILIGRRFRLAHIRFGKKIIEVSTFRAGETEATLIVKDNIFGSPEEDVLRRDFTINGLFYDPEVQTVIDYVDGYLDIEKKILRTIGDPKTRFIQDPVRMIRLLKFKARFDFTIEKKTFDAMQECMNEIIKSSSTRILEEFFKMLSSGSCKNFFYLLTKFRLLKILSPNLYEFFKESENSYNLLEALDQYFQKNYFHDLPRAVLLSTFCFNFLEIKIKNKYLDKNIYPHLGQIAETARDILLEIFLPFFHLPKRLKAEIISILTNQYRILPINPKNSSKIRISKDPFFELSLTFFNLRCIENPKLTKIYALWKQRISKLNENRKKPKRRY